MLTDIQKDQVAQWVNDGLSLAQVQTRIVEEFGVPMTYMDVRFLVDDLDLELKDAASEKSVPVGGELPEAVPETARDSGVPEEKKSSPAVSVSVDPVQTPGVLVGGSVTFSDGVSAQWFLDQSGQLGFDGLPKGYRPPVSDVPEFQTKLGRELRRLGYQ